MKKKIGSNYGILVIILFAVVCALTDYIIIGRKINEGKNTVIETKTDCVSSVCNCDDNAESSDKMIANNYQIFSQTMKKNISKYSTNDMANQFVDSSVVKDGYSVYMDGSGSLYIKFNNNDYISKFGNYKIADNILNFYVFEIGQDRMNTVFFINEDGTVGSADVDFGVNNGSITVKKDLGYKNIVSVVSGAFGMDYSGAKDAIFIDINGNMFSKNFEF